MVGEHPSFSETMLWSGQELCEIFALRVKSDESGGIGCGWDRQNMKSCVQRHPVRIFDLQGFSRPLSGLGGWEVDC